MPPRLRSDVDLARQRQRQRVGVPNARVAECVLSKWLESTTSSSIIDSSNECFNISKVRALAAKYPEELNKTGNRWKNFVRLLTGYQVLPMIVLLNPENDHTKDYQDMIDCPTFDWISQALEKHGLELEDVPILDICSFFSTADLGGYGSQKWLVAEDSYKVTEAILQILRPQVVVVCQCATAGTQETLLGAQDIWSMKGGTEPWKPAENEFASGLCSSEPAMQAGLARPVSLGSHEMWMVPGVHPARILREEDLLEKAKLRRDLNQVFEEVFSAWAPYVELVRRSAS